MNRIFETRLRLTIYRIVKHHPTIIGSKELSRKLRSAIGEDWVHQWKPVLKKMLGDGFILEVSAMVNSPTRNGTRRMVLGKGYVVKSRKVGYKDELGQETDDCNG